MLANGQYPVPPKADLTPASDGAGVVEAIGKSVTRFQKGDRVVTTLYTSFVAGLLDRNVRREGLGGTHDGTMRQYGVFNEHGLVLMPSNLNFLEGATLTCAALTSWNSLFGLADRRLSAGDWVLTQGTGGVSLFALQFAKCVGAKVIATTSSEVKAERLRQLGADHVINYVECKNWGNEASKIAGFRGIRHVIELGGSQSLQQSLAAVGTEGVVSIIGALGGFDNQQETSTMLAVLLSACILRGIVGGTRMQFEEMNRAIEAHDIKPIIDDRVFTLEELREAYDVSYPSMIHDRHLEWMADSLFPCTSTCGIRSISERCALVSNRLVLYLPLYDLL